MILTELTEEEMKLVEGGGVTDKHFTWFCSDTCLENTPGEKITLAFQQGVNIDVADHYENGQLQDF